MPSPSEMAWLKRRAPLMLPADRTPPGYRWAIRTALAILALAAGLVGAASAATITGGGRGERLRGTGGADLILAAGGRDVVDARAGDDRVAVQYDGARDDVRCGPGRDVVTADRADRVAADCEVVSRLVSRDPFTVAAAQHETQVEPSAFASGNTVVTAFQSGRRHAGGATGIGFATSRDAGGTWRGGHLPALTVDSTPAGTAALVSDPVVAYDATHRLWLISTLAVSSGRTELYVSRSADGARWEAPVVAARFSGSRLGFDKNWVACDNWPQSPHLGRCYLAYTDETTSTRSMGVQVSDDGGATWSTTVIAVRAPEVVGVLPLPRPDGSLVVPYLGKDEIQSVRSTDGGLTFEEPVTVSPVRARKVQALRAFPLPTADVDGRGRVYVAWPDCSVNPGCNANGVVLSDSTDGKSWSPPRRATPGGGTAFVPALAVERESGRLALVYHRCAGSPCSVDVLVTTSSGPRGAWSHPQVLDAQAMRATWMPSTVSGRMLGDYVGISWVGRGPVIVYALASPPRGGKLRQAIAAVRLSG
jgi:hypothetical protein